MTTFKKATPGSDSLTAVKQYVTNARALLDTLNHYESLKERTVLLRTDLQFSQSEKLGLKLQLVRANISLDSCRTAGPAVATVDGKLKAARAENWVWRGVFVLVLIDVASRVITALK